MSRTDRLKLRACGLAYGDCGGLGDSSRAQTGTVTMVGLALLRFDPVPLRLPPFRLMELPAAEARLESR